MALPVNRNRKIILDTNIFIDYLRDGRHEDWVAGQIDGTVRFLSTVVLMELRFGADTPKRRRVVEQLRDAFPPRRLIPPAPEHFERAADILRALLGRNLAADRLGLLNDVLIALTAWQIGAVVITNNVKDFNKIAKHLPGLLLFAPPVSG